MSINLSRPALVGAAAALLLLGLGAGYFLSQTGRAPDAAKPAQSSEPEVLYWYDPMRPEAHFDKPGKSPFMDMQLVPKYRESGSVQGLRISPDARQSLGIRTELVAMGQLESAIRVPATLTWDLRRESVVSARVDSIVAQLGVKAPYTQVKRGQLLATVLAPAWSSAIAEARALDGSQTEDAVSLRGAARERLRVLGLDGNATASGNSVALRAPIDGVVSEIMVREGQLAMAGMPLFRVNGIETLWLEAAIPQAGAAGVIPGTPVSAVVSAFPGQRFEGEVEVLLPQVDAASRTQRARIVLRNPDGLLAPGMFAELSLRPLPGKHLPLIPSEALVSTGSDNRVIVVASDGSFAPVRVEAGRSFGGRTEILSGLAGGERVVSSGQFLIDSEASLSGALDRMQGNDAPPPETAGEMPGSETQMHVHEEGAKQ